MPCVPCGKAELDLESVPSTQVVVTDEYTIETGPTSTLDTKAPLEFELPGSGEDYLDPGSLMLYLLVKLRNGDGSKIDFKANDGQAGTQRDVGPVNLPAHSIFSQLELIVNDTLVASSNNTYPYKAYFATALSFSKAVKKGWLADTQGLRMDDIGKDDEAGNTAMHTFCDGKINSDGYMVLVMRPHLDLCHQDRLLPNGVSIRLRFTRSPDSFFMMSQDPNQKPFKVTIEEARLRARRVKLAASEQMRLERVIATKGARYPLTHCATKNFTLPMGTSSIDVDSIFTGQRPNKIALGMVSNESFNGSYSKSPFNFKNYNLTSACLVVDGQQLPTKGMHFDFEEKFYIDGYLALLQCTDTFLSNFDNGISAERFANGSTLLCFDLTPDHDGGAGDHVTPRRNGVVKASLRFKKPLPETVTLLVFGQFDNTLLIDKNRSVLFDYVA